jgi:hypothetical protein
MELRDLYLIFGLGLALLAVVVSIIGLRSENFPSPKAMFALLGLTVFLVIGTGFYAWEFSVEEAEHKKEGKEVIGEEASINPIQVPSAF